jgi:hypothetical protein
MQQSMVGFESSLDVSAALLEMLVYNDFLANPSRPLYEVMDHELVDHLVSLAIV